MLRCSAPPTGRRTRTLDECLEVRNATLGARRARRGHERQREDAEERDNQSRNDLTTFIAKPRNDGRQRFAVVGPKSVAATRPDG